MISTESMTHEPRRSSDTVEALLAATARMPIKPIDSRTANHPDRPWTLGYVDATEVQRSADLGEHTARIREYAERHHLT